MVAKTPRIVIIGAGMAGLVAAHKLYRAAGSRDIFELCVVEGGNRIGGRISTSEFGGNQIEMGATWIHGIGGSPVHQIATEIGALESNKPWERMDGFPEDPVTVAEGGFEIDLSMEESVSNLYRKLMEFAQGKLIQGSETDEEFDYYKIAVKALKSCASSNGGLEKISIGSFLRKGLEAYWVYAKEGEEANGNGNGNGKWTPKLLEEAIFAMHENTERTYTSAGDLFNLDFKAEREYHQFPGEEISIAKGYSSIIQSIASVLPNGLIQLGKKVAKIEWQSDQSLGMHDYGGTRPVKLHFDDGSSMDADHVIVTVSLGVLKAGIGDDSGMFSPPLPSFKTEAISRLGFGVVNKLFLQVGPPSQDQENKNDVFPFLQMAFQQSDSKSKHQKIPWWMRKTTSLCPIHNNSSVVLSWFAGEEALELESLEDEKIIEGVSTTISTFLHQNHVNSHICSNGNVDSKEYSGGLNFTKLLKSQWGSNPLFRGSYSYVAVGSSGDDLDSMAKPLPSISKEGVSPLQILFAGEATHRTHYSTTHGAYFSGIREANRLLQHYQCGGISELLHH